MPQVDFLIIGTGIAGLSYAYKLSQSFPYKQIAIVTKSSPEESSTNYAQGGIAIVTNPLDSYTEHIADTLRAGDGLCDPTVVSMVVKEGPDCLQELLKVGTHFDQNANQEFDLGKEGGHSTHRILHHKDTTGREIAQKLIQKVSEATNVAMYDHHFAIDLITEHHFLLEIPKEDLSCYGAYVLNELSKQVEVFEAQVTLLATGGSGQLYGHTTKPAIATGDGIGMAYRAKANISDMEFIQFHPTAFYDPGSSPLFLISEAVRGAGAKLQTRQGEYFMHKYDERGELASRDIVARAIDQEMKISGDEYVYLDCTEIDSKKFQQHFPNIKAFCISKGIDPTHSCIPVTPAAHYACGGVSVDMDGKTTIHRLLACGEVSRTGLHGANRLASNSLLEALVYAEKCAQTARMLTRESHPQLEIPEWDTLNTTPQKVQIAIAHNRKVLQSIMRDYVGIARNTERLMLAERHVRALYKETEQWYHDWSVSVGLYELRNMLATAHLIIKQSLQRRENRGGFWNEDLVRDPHHLS